MVFFQRRMYWPKSVVGLCELEPKEKRCQRFDRQAQRFRILQEVNNLRYIDPDVREECRLDDGQRSLLVEFLSQREKATFDQIRKELGFLDSVKFNLERGQRSSLKGMIVDWMMAKAVGKEWHKRDEAEKDAIVRMLLNNEREDELIAGRLAREFGFTQRHAEAALEVNFPAGYVNLSRKAIDRLLPHLQRGLVYQSLSDPEQSALHAAGYLRRDELRRRLFDELPDLRRVNIRDCSIGDIPNPVVKRTLVELRKLVNALIREYGKPHAVHVEMARSIQMGPKARSEYNGRIRDRELARDRAADEIRKYDGVKVNRESILRFLLWEEQGRECVYCQKPMSQKQVFGGEVNIDHILPYSRCLDDSQANKVLVHWNCNHDKGQTSPYEWLAQRDPRSYERICQKAASLMKAGQMPYGKYRKFLQKTLDLDDFIARQLTDTGYIARATGEYMRLLFEAPHAVLGLKGQQTAELRRQWGLNTVLRHDDMDRKNRDDYRHHAVDAIVVALTNRSTLQTLTRATVETQMRNRKTSEIEYASRYVGESIPEPWRNFRESVEQAMNGICISHRPQRKVAGGLHEDTLYGKTGDEGVFVVRKPLQNLSPNEVQLIRDNAIRRVVEQRLAEHGIDVGRGKTVDAAKWKAAVCDVSRPLLLPPNSKRLARDREAQGIPIKKVRVFRKELTIQPIRVGRVRAGFRQAGRHPPSLHFRMATKGEGETRCCFCHTVGSDQSGQKPSAGHSTNASPWSSHDSARRALCHVAFSRRDGVGELEGRTTAPHVQNRGFDARANLLRRTYGRAKER